MPKLPNAVPEANLDLAPYPEIETRNALRLHDGRTLTEPNP